MIERRIALILRFKEQAALQRSKRLDPWVHKDQAIIYVREVGAVKPLTHREETALIARSKGGDQKARERMIKANLRRVVKICREYENSGLPLLDLISEGNNGLMKAVEGFEPCNGNNFSTYSTWWITQSIKRAIANRLAPFEQAA